MSKHHKNSHRSDARQNMRRVLWHFQDRVCALCLLEMSNPDEVLNREGMLAPSAPSLDHFVPASQNGPKAIWNMLLVHRRCNDIRGDGPVPAHTLAIHERIFMEFAPKGQK